jgi:hypothetical protein
MGSWPSIDLALNLFLGNARPTTEGEIRMRSEADAPSQNHPDWPEVASTLEGPYGDESYVDQDIHQGVGFEVPLLFDPFNRMFALLIRHAERP